MATLNYRQIRLALSAQDEFKGNSMRAEIVNEIDHVSPGRLDAEETAILRSVHGLAYVVFSYNTPIAWVTDSGVKHIVEQRFSVTTSRQQTLVRAWF